jgi:hypothetical protein
MTLDPFGKQVLAWIDAASPVLGFPDFTTTLNNNLESNMMNSRGLTFDQTGNLFVVDNGGSRVLLFVPPFTNGMNATGVVGQPNLTALDATKTPPASSGLANPVGVSRAHWPAPHFETAAKLSSGSLDLPRILRQLRS